MGRAKEEWMEEENRGWSDPDDKFVCPDCVENDYLKEIIRSNATVRQCDYCGKRTRSHSAAPILCLMEPIGKTLLYYFNEPTQAGVPSEGSNFVFESFYSTEEVLADIGLECDDQLFEDISAAFNNNAWVQAAGGHWSSSHPHEDYIDAWGSFAQIVKHEVRYFFQELSAVAPDDFEPGRFSPLNLLVAIGTFVEEQGWIKALSAGEVLFRARERFANDTWEPDHEKMGAPPPNLARAGRMNPAGISYFYLAFDEQTALTEVLSGPPCSVAIARFEVLQDLYVLDLFNLTELSSIFDDSQRWERERLLFLKKFVEEISKPVKKNGQEHIEYVPSQVVSEYFAHVFLAGGEHSLDGMIYPSAIRPGGINLVLFPNKRNRDKSSEPVGYQDCKIVTFEDWTEYTSAI